MEQVITDTVIACGGDMERARRAWNLFRWVYFSSRKEAATPTLLAYFQSLGVPDIDYDNPDLDYHLGVWREKYEGATHHYSQTFIGALDMRRYEKLEGVHHVSLPRRIQSYLSDLWRVIRSKR